MISEHFAPPQAAEPRAVDSHRPGKIELVPFDPSHFREGSSTWQRWSRLLRDASEHPHLLHIPELIRYEFHRTSLRRTRPALLVTETQSSPRSTPVSCMLLPHDIRTNDPSLGQIGPCKVIDGYRLAGGQLVGGERPTDWARFLSALFQSIPNLVLWVDDVEQNSALAQQLSSPECRSDFRVFSSRMETRSRIALPEDEQSYWASLTKNTRKDARNTLKRASDLRMQCFADPEDVAEFLVDAATVAEYSWQGQAGKPPIRDDVAEHQRLAAVAAQGALRAYMLYDNDEPIAFEIDYVLSDSVLGLECGYDLRHRDRSPGKVLQLRVLQDLLNHHIARLYDFGNGDMFYKRRYANATSTSGDVVLLPPNWRGKCLAGYLAACAGAHQLSRRALEKLGLLDVLRRLKRSRKFAAGDATSH